MLKRLLALFTFGPTSPTAERDANHYFRLATQYYLLARAGSFAACLPVAGNLFHHAGELFLKGDLVEQQPRTVLKRHGHDLKRLWTAFRRMHQGVDLSAHDPTIRQLAKFETIRYPDLISDRGMFSTISVARPPEAPTIQVATGRVPPSYHSVANDIDHLVRAIFDASSVNPEFYFGGIPADWRLTLHRDNPAFPAASRQPIETLSRLARTQE